ncbi:hypothetical protein ACKI2N_032010 [Cupriavidus sp. 30B13]|uniref:endonuclease toxin domain-containing protein n=1 Tax=Cupriavidus sp. 30B13 TaxID=3384241 RepID=UPI003B911BFE
MSTALTGTLGGADAVNPEDIAAWRKTNPGIGAFDARPTVQYQVDVEAGTVTRSVVTSQSFIEDLKDLGSLGLRPLGKSLGTFLGGASVALDDGSPASTRAQGAFDAGANALSVPAAVAAVGAPLVRSSATDAGIKWGGGIQGQGMPWENYLADQLPAGSRLPPNFKTFDFFDRMEGVAISAKTLDTTTVARLAKPEQIYTSLKANVDATASFEGYTLRGVSLYADDVAARQLRVAVPERTTAPQWQQIQRAIDYGQSKGVQIIVTPTR